MSRPFLILDLDETMVAASDTEPPDGFDFKVFEYFVRRRPHTVAFLERVSAWFGLAVWSSGDDTYATAIAAQLFSLATPPRFVWGRTRCVTRYDEELRTPYFLKDLKKVKRRGYDLRRVLIIDDSPEKVSRNYGNHLRLRPFVGSAEDRELDFPAYVERVSLDALFERSDILSLHVPLNDETRGMVDGALLARMRRGGMLVNTARGAVVDVDAVLRALDAGQLNGAALDVLPVEPLATSHPLARHPRVLLTPHAAFYSTAAEIELRRKAALNIVQWATTGRPMYPVIQGTKSPVV